METTEDLLNYLVLNIPNFSNPKIIENGVAFHYTMHSDLILIDNQIKGVIIDANIDCTQHKLISTPATDINGVVFAYEDINDSIEEGFVLQSEKLINKIFRIEYESSIRADHVQEVAFSDAPPTIIILANKINRFEIVYP